MNKNEAAAFLKIGVRSLERYTSAGRVTAQKIKVKTGFALDYDPAELARFKTELEAPPPASPNGADNSEIALARISSASLATSSANASPDSADAMARLAVQSPILALLIEELAARRAEKLTAPNIVQETASKVLLTLDDCQRLTGLSRAILRDAIESGDLKAKKIGRAWRIKRNDLDKFVESL